jgi:hypothetical protein
MKMAGYEPTPYEEMNVIETEPEPEVKKYSKEELKEMAIKKLSSASSPDEYFTVFNNIKRSGHFTDTEFEEIIKVVNKINL